MHPPWLQATDRLEYRYADFTDNQGRLRELLQLNIIRLFAVDRSMQDDLYINSSFRTAVASCYVLWRWLFNANHFCTIPLEIGRDQWLKVTIIRWSANSGGH